MSRARIEKLTALGLRFNGQFFVCGPIKVWHRDVEDMSDEDFAKLVKRTDRTKKYLEAGGTL